MQLIVLQYNIINVHKLVQMLQVEVTGNVVPLQSFNVRKPAPRYLLPKPFR